MSRTTTGFIRIRTLTEFDEVVAEADKRGIGIIMDLVVNETAPKMSGFL